MRRMCFLLSTLLLSGCFGVSATVVIRANGAGSITMEYHISQTLESLGKQDGNERYPPIPVGKVDFERTVNRIPGLRLRSFSAKTVGTDVVTQVRMDFSTTDALLTFFDAQGGRASLNEVSGKQHLSFILSEGPAKLDPDLQNLVNEVTAGYTISMTFNLPRTGELRLTDSAGNLIPGQSSSGTTLSFSVPVSGALNGLQADILW
ncbi:hypothetical protein FACS1894164_13260 [Spirochaetia bacterium]|nr:hypothetical protein FACS1894164_13260 [Spirochaetia bacterium]